MRTQTSGWITSKRRWAIYLRDNLTCLYCGTDLRGDLDHLSLDHLVCRSASVAAGVRPDHGNANVVTCCKACNSSRGNRCWRAFAPGGAVERIERQITQPVDLTAARRLLRGDARIETR